MEHGCKIQRGDKSIWEEQSFKVTSLMSQNKMPKTNIFNS